jgi:hypothetical protein
MYENERDGNRGDKEQSGFASYSAVDVRRAFLLWLMATRYKLTTMDAGAMTEP